MKNLCIILFSAGLIFSCQQKDRPYEPPNILWITNEDTAPAWGCYGDEYVSTPHIDKLADEGYVFTRAFSNAPICAPARSTLITGQYATSLGTQHLRSQIPLPAEMKILPELLKDAGYYTTNNSKTDYNFSPEGRWHENSNEAHWRNAPDDRPFFSVFNFGITHEGHTNTIREEDTESLEQHHDPADAKLPPYFPDTGRYREIWANMYDLISVFDQEVGKLVEQLKEDGEYESTMIFVFSDHGFGLPRYKRWMYNSGVHVPFILHVPERYKGLVNNLNSDRPDNMVGFVDFAPTVLNLAGTAIPDRMEGKNFLGEGSRSNEYIYGYRDRADDCYDMSRAVYDGRYIYIRNFMPHIPYIQNAVIYNRGKAGFEELFRVQEEGTLPPEAEDMFEAKPVEELYDLENDPYELDNLLENDPDNKTADKLRKKLHEWMVKYRDTGLLNEGEMMIKAGGEGSVYEMARQQTEFPVPEILDAAELVGRINDTNELIPYFNSEEPAVRYWALVALDAYQGDIAGQKSRLLALLEDESYSVAILAAEILVKNYNDRKALAVLEEILRLDNEPVVLQAAISVRKIGKKAMPLIPVIQDEIMPKYSGNVWGRYKSWMYPMFIGMALDQTLVNCGYEVNIRN